MSSMIHSSMLMKVKVRSSPSAPPPPPPPFSVVKERLRELVDQMCRPDPELDDEIENIDLDGSRLREWAIEYGESCIESRELSEVQLLLRFVKR